MALAGDFENVVKLGDIQQAPVPTVTPYIHSLKLPIENLPEGEIPQRKHRRRHSRSLHRANSVDMSSSDSDLDLDLGESINFNRNESIPNITQLLPVKLRLEPIRTAEPSLDLSESMKQRSDFERKRNKRRQRQKQKSKENGQNNSGASENDSTKNKEQKNNIHKPSNDPKQYFENLNKFGKNMRAAPAKRNSLLENMVDSTAITMPEYGALLKDKKSLTRQHFLLLKQQEERERKLKTDQFHQTATSLINEAYLKIESADNQPDIEQSPGRSDKQIETGHLENRSAKSESKSKSDDQPELGKADKAKSDAQSPRRSKKSDKIVYDNNEATNLADAKKRARPTSALNRLMSGISLESENTTFSAPILKTNRPVTFPRRASEADASLMRQIVRTELLALHQAEMMVDH